MRVPLIAPAAAPDCSADGQTRIMVGNRRSRVTIDTSPAMRRAVRSPGSIAASPAVTEQFGFVETNVPAFKDLYAGKLRAPRSRRHPRDLFDLKLFYDNEGLTD